MSRAVKEGRQDGIKTHCGKYLVRKPYKEVGLMIVESLNSKVFKLNGGLK